MILFYLFSPNEQCEGWGGGYAARLFFFSLFFPVQQITSGIGHRVKCFFGLATNTLNVENNNFFPQTGGCSEGLGAFRFLFKQQHNVKIQPVVTR